MKSGLKLLCILIAAALFIPFSADSAEYSGTSKNNIELSETKRAMGTFVSITLVHGLDDEAGRALSYAFEEMYRLSKILSRFDSGSPVSVLNRDGKIENAPAELIEVIEESKRIHKITDGAFDITVKPVVDLLRDHFKDGSSSKFPSTAKINDASALIDMDGIVIMEEGCIYFRNKGMGITLDGIAKGYIVDRMAEILNLNGISNYLINAGGDIRAQGMNSEGKHWVIAIEDPKKARNYPDIITINNGALATSGNYENYFDQNKLFHHIINPHTGSSPLYNYSVSVKAKTAAEADALATALFTMKPEKAIKLIESLDGTDCMILTKGWKILKSSGW